MNQKFNDSNAFLLWHERLTLICTCSACSKGKLIIRPSFTKVTFESPAFLERIQGDICGQHPVAHVHFQNGLAESFIKHLQLIARPLLLKTKLPLSAWGHAIIHAAHLIRLHPTANHDLSPLQLTKGYQPNISHLRIFVVLFMFPLPPHIDLS